MGELTNEEREHQIKLALSHIKLRLKQRGDDPSKYNPKFLRDKAEAVIDEWLKDNPGQKAYVPLEDKWPAYFSCSCSPPVPATSPSRITKDF